MRHPHIDLGNDAYGIRSLVMYRPETGEHLYELVQVLLRGPSPLTPGERERIAAHVSELNNCEFCMNSHAAAASELKHDHEPSAKLDALLNIAGKVQKSGTEVKEEDVEAARRVGATDLDIHDTVLIAAVFSMFNRYVDGLNTTRPGNIEEYIPMGKRMTELGYVMPK